VAVTVGAMSLLFNSWVPVVAESVVLVGRPGVTLLNVRRTYHDRWLAYRALAVYWRSNQYMGIVSPPSPDRASAPAPLMEQTLTRVSIVPWFAPVVENIWDARPQFRVAGDDVPWMKEVLINDWIDDQRQWHRRTGRRHERIGEWYQRAIGMVFGLSVLLVVLHATQTIVEFVVDHSRELRTTGGGAIAIVVFGLASAGAALSGLASHANHPGHAERFSDVAYDLDQLRKDVEAAEDLDGLRKSVLAVFQTMLGETNSWFQGMAASEIEVPTSCHLGVGTSSPEKWCYDSQGAGPRNLEGARSC
jgi:hypothetical protein